MTTVKGADVCLQCYNDLVDMYEMRINYESYMEKKYTQRLAREDRINSLANIVKTLGDKNESGTTPVA